ncbi:hypothetical protein B0X71_14545 [Planococcus lenghuensis]|uniref:Uncharacterized protein n=2 Tax=Planococcus lenghuensis TaxID=2213202 RepID=A0A1Q2L167_9BACL|nr:hypothetical protein B0X71_14545 [Planococcus lenghuensis]
MITKPLMDYNLEVYVPVSDWQIVYISAITAMCAMRNSMAEWTWRGRGQAFDNEKQFFLLLLLIKQPEILIQLKKQLFQGASYHLVRHSFRLDILIPQNY